MCSYIVKGVLRPIQRHYYVFESNVDSWEGLCNFIQRRAYVVRFKYIPTRRFVVLVGFIVCGG